MEPARVAVADLEGLALRETSLVNACADAHGHGETAVRRATMSLSKLLLLPTFLRNPISH